MTEYESKLWSADGTKIELTVPDVDILFHIVEWWLCDASGTSMAAPFVSGVAALVKGKNPSMTSPKILDILAYGAIDLGAVGRDRMSALAAQEQGLQQV